MRIFFSLVAIYFSSCLILNATCPVITLPRMKIAPIPVPLVPNRIIDSVPPANTGKSHLGSITFLLPVDEFSGSHSFGFGLSYAWSHKRFGTLQLIPAKLLGFTAEIGVRNFIGKMENIAANEFTYGDYLYMHLFGGVIYNPLRKGNIRLMGGPTLGLYMRDSEFGMGGQLDASYHMGDRISVSPGLYIFKHKQANAQFSVYLKLDYAF